MEDLYTLDLKKISLETYAQELEQAVLLPSRRILQEEIGPRFAILRQQGIHNLSEVLAALKTPEKIKTFAQKSALPEDYLVILKREIASYQPPPVKLKDFPGIEIGAIQKLAELGIENTKQLFEKVKTPIDRQSLADKTGIAISEILELTQLVDVVRIRWVGANFARLLVDSSCNTLEKVCQAEYASLYAELVKINQEKSYFKGMFGQNDMKLCVLAARQVPQVIEY
jgi:hypothetical protein